MKEKNSKEKVEKTKKKEKKSPWYRSKIFICAIVLVVCAAISFFVLRMLLPNENKNGANNEATNSQDNTSKVEKELTDCLASTGDTDWNAKIECYEKHRVDNSDEVIADFTQRQKLVDRSKCLEQANATHNVTEQEIYATTNTQEIINIYYRMISGVDASLQCYSYYSLGDSTEITEVARLNSAKEGMNQEIASLQNSLNNSTSYNYTPPPISQPYVYEAPQNTMTCDDYHEKYYSEYSSKRSEINSSYNSAISNASMQCSSYGGCPAVTSLQAQRDAELSQLKSTYQSNMRSVGCEPRI